MANFIKSQNEHDHSVDVNLDAIAYVEYHSDGRTLVYFMGRDTALSLKGDGTELLKKAIEHIEPPI